MFLRSAFDEFEASLVEGVSCESNLEVGNVAPPLLRAAKACWIP